MLFKKVKKSAGEGRRCRLLSYKPQSTLSTLFQLPVWHHVIKVTTLSLAFFFSLPPTPNSSQRLWNPSESDFVRVNLCNSRIEFRAAALEWTTFPNIDCLHYLRVLNWRQLPWWRPSEAAAWSGAGRGRRQQSGSWWLKLYKRLFESETGRRRVWRRARRLCKGFAFCQVNGGGAEASKPRGIHLNYPLNNWPNHVSAQLPSPLSFCFILFFFKNMQIVSAAVQPPSSYSRILSVRGVGGRERERESGIRSNFRSLIFKQDRRITCLNVG